MRALKRNLSIPSLIAVIALGFSMSGGAFAAHGYLENSGPRAAKPSPHVAKKGARRGPRGLRGIQGIPGPRGPDGPEGPVGATGPRGLGGDPWTAGGTLPSGKSQSGTWAAATFGSQGTDIAAVSFGFQLLSSPDVHVIGKGFDGIQHSTECPGSVGVPLAAKGNVCFYTVENEGLTLLEAFPFTSGTLLKFKGPTFGAAVAGTWAVTAP